MSTPNWKAVFLAEYYTTTSKFRKYRVYIPLFFIGGVIFFSYFIRAMVQFVSENTTISQPPLDRFYAIISIFSFFTFFAPIVSPLGRVVYDGNAQSRREVALSSPVRAHELLYGNLLSNLVFFLPFYVMVGTVSLSAFVGSGVIDPLITSIHIIATLVLLVIMGLFGGTIVTPLVLNFIAKQRNEIARSIVTLLVAGMLMVSLPLLQYIIDSLEVSSNLGILTYLPFTLASTIIVYAIYGEIIGVSLGIAYSLLIIYTMLVIIIGYFIAEKLYQVNESGIVDVKSAEESRTELLLQFLSKPIPSPSIRELFISMVKASIRDIEHMSRLTIGLASTIFFVYALSPQGLFRGQRIAAVELERAAVLFALILSASMTIYIEAASFLIQHKSMLTLIKSAPHAPRRFVLAKLLQMIFIQSPVFIILLFLLRILDFSADLNLYLISAQIVLLIFCMTAIILGLFLLNPSDNEEDLTNFINLIIFYSISLMIASFPIAQAMGISVGVVATSLYYITILALAGGMILLGIKALEELDLETMSSEFSRKISSVFLVLVLTLASWNILPLPAYLIYISFPNIGLLIALTLLLPLALPIFYWVRKGFPVIYKKPTLKVLIEAGIAYFSLMVVGLGLLFLVKINSNISAPSVSSLLFALGIDLKLILLYITTTVITEELFFRGYIIDFLKERNLRKKYVILSSALIFSLFHILSPISFIFAIFGGVVLALLRERSESLFIPVLVHLLYNVTVIFISI